MTKAIKLLALLTLVIVFIACDGVKHPKTSPVVTYMFTPSPDIDYNPWTNRS